MNGAVSPPAWSCDAHTHVFDVRFPASLPSAYALPEAPFAAHRANLEANGLARGVLIQPAPYGQDTAAMIDALHASQGRLRGVACAKPDIADDSLAAMHDAGVRALRFVEARTPTGDRYPGSVEANALTDLASRMTAIGWHAELWSPLQDVLGLWPQLERLGLPVVLDHMGGFDVTRGVDDPSFQRLLALVREGAVWIKLTLCRRAPFGSDFAELRPFHDALVAANPGRMLWGSDWPFVRMGENAPTTARVLDLFLKWVDDPQLRQRILADNPAVRYHFQPGD